MGGRESGKMSTDTVLMLTDTTPFALPFIGGVVLAVACRVPQNNFNYGPGPHWGTVRKKCPQVRYVSHVYYAVYIRCIINNNYIIMIIY